MSRVLLMQGNQAVVEGAIAAGVRFYGGYPITPSTEIAEGMAKRLPQVGGKFMQTEDELAGIGTVVGASLGGVKAMTVNGKQIEGNFLPADQLEAVNEISIVLG